MATVAVSFVPERSTDFVNTVVGVSSLPSANRRFASVIDSGLFHVFHGDDRRRRYVQGLAHVLLPGGRLFLFCFSNEKPLPVPGGGFSRQDLYDAFADGWEIESVQLVGGEVNPAFEEEYRDGKMWFAIIRRKEAATSDASKL